MTDKEIWDRACLEIMSDLLEVQDKIRKLKGDGCMCPPGLMEAAIRACEAAHEVLNFAGEN